MTTKQHSDDVSIVPARPEDAPAIKALVASAYTKYIERIGKPPAPMTFDYAAEMDKYDIYILQQQDPNRIVGSIVLSKNNPNKSSLEINNVVVDPTQQGSGYGRLLMDFAEQVARARGLAGIELYTNEKMWENVAIYPKLGYVETGRREQDGFQRVYFRKEL